MKNIIIPKIINAIRILQMYLRYWFKTYKFNPDMYPESYITKEPIRKKSNLKNAPEVIYTLWTGDNDLSKNRKIGFKTLQEKTGVKVVLITPKVLNKFILKNYPLHKSYKYLSLNHRSDYLRCYLMLHYGGGYADIKNFNKSWITSFKKLNSSNDKWCLGYQEKSCGGVAFTNGKLGRGLIENYLFLLGNGAYIFKPNNSISKECMKELDTRLDSFYESLKMNPATDPFGQNSNYPIPWNYLGGHILHPLELKYNNRIIHSDDVRPLKGDYR